MAGFQPRARASQPFLQQLYSALPPIPKLSPAAALVLNQLTCTQGSLPAWEGMMHQLESASFANNTLTGVGFVLQNNCDQSVLTFCSSMTLCLTMLKGH